MSDARPEIYLTRPWQATVAAWPEPLRIEHARRVAALYAIGWNPAKTGAAWVIFDRMRNEIQAAKEASKS